MIWQKLLFYLLGHCAIMLHYTMYQPYALTNRFHCLLKIINRYNLHMYRLQVNHLKTGWLGCIRILAIVSNTAVNMRVYIFFSQCFSFVWINTQKGNGWIVWYFKFLVLIFWGISILFFTVALSFYILSNIV